MLNKTSPNAIRPIAAELNPHDDPNQVLAGWKEGITLPNIGYLEVLLQSPLPGVVIFVHGVNSDGEWYTQAEDGLCKGLNDRLKRRNEHMKYPTPAGGQLTPAAYMPELTADGYINPDMLSDTFIQGDEFFSPVIHFRWGYKASSDELQKYGSGIYLNEHGYWGGGPFANGCTTLPDLWGEGLSADLFLWMQVQTINPTNDRNVYSCPPRPYYVLAALRLAKLMKSIREKQADVPITIVCHSQGNLIGMAAAFLGDKMKDVADPAGQKGRCVADTYVLCNAPYSLVKSNFTEGWSHSNMTDKKGGTGRQTANARMQTLAVFFKIVGKQAKVQMSFARIDKFMANEVHRFTAQSDADTYGLNSATYGRVTLYCNPHDQVISASPVQGIGWRGLSAQEINAASGNGVFAQRVFAQDFEVGKMGQYHYWKNHYKKPAAGSPSYWFPQSKKATYSLSKGIDASGNFPSKVLTVLAAPIAIIALKLAGMAINALPDKDWEIPLNAPDLPEAFVPQALRFGLSSKEFDQGYDAPGELRDKDRARDKDDPYAADRLIPKGGSEGVRKDSDVAAGDRDSEASLRYEDHARLRMQAKRDKVDKKDEKVAGEDNPEKSARPEYKAWRDNQIKTYLAANIDTHATDHSTIMSNGMHAQAALAYDVAIGNCHMLEADWHQLRVAADWRFLKGLNDDDSNKVFFEYFNKGKFQEKSSFEWAHDKNSEGAIPDTITDEREHPVRHPVQRGGKA